MYGELLFFRITPINISVLSHDNIEIKINSLQTALTMMPDLEIICTDSCECFDANKGYLRQRERTEGNAAVRRLLHQDAQMLTELQAEMSTARQFVFIRRCSGLKQEQVLSLMNDTHKHLADTGFEVQRMKKPEIKRFLAICFGASMKVYLTEEDWKDVKKAIQYLTHAAEDGNSYGTYQLGKLYYFGNGVRADPEKGLEYLKASAAQGNQYAATLLQIIQQQRTWGAAMCASSLLAQLGRLFQEKEQERKLSPRPGLGRKLRQEIAKKKQALGLRD